MKPRVYKSMGLWAIMVKGEGGLSTLVVDDWSEAVRIALLAKDDPLRLVDIGHLRAAGRSLDKDFRV